MLYTAANTIGLDFETYAGVSLPAVGLENYVNDKDFRPLVARTHAYSVVGAGMAEEYPFAGNITRAQGDLKRHLSGFTYIAAHNAPFEKRVLDWLGIHLDASRFVDSAVVARAAGAGGHLESAAPQLLGVDKMVEGKQLMKLFSMAGKYQEAAGNNAFDHAVIDDHPGEWATYCEYCGLDAKLSLDLVLQFGNVLTYAEHRYMSVTTEMNETGWHVDVDLVREMKRRYEDNVVKAEHTFRLEWAEPTLNFNSLKQMKEFCHGHGIKANSFDEKHVASLLKRIEAKLESMDPLEPKYLDYLAVFEMLKTKQILGGSSLKKLDVILRTVDKDSRLTDQYVHAGAGQTLRTSGRSVQMQNLKRLKEPGNMEDLADSAVLWSNDRLAENLRQVFTASDPSGAIIVGDFSSVESRGLAYLSGERWKLLAFKRGQDLYKVGAARQYSVLYDDVTKPQRQFGKVGELSCGYGAGGPAVQEFAKNMGVDMTEGEAVKLVADWRNSNPKVVDFWHKLDEMLHESVTVVTSTHHPLLFDGLGLSIRPWSTPDTLLAQHPGSQSISVELHQHGDLVMRRIFHGCYVRGRNISYYKPSELKSGALWKASYIHPKTGVPTFHSVYGGKLAGIITQSFCREIFFRVLGKVNNWAKKHSNLEVIGQFHDEIVLEWDAQAVAAITRAEAEQWLKMLMSDPVPYKEFPLAAEVHSDYRYIK